MANHKSAEKRARQNKKRHLRNTTIRSATKSKVKDALTKILAASSKEEAIKALVAGEKALRKAASKGVIPAKRASRKVSRLAEKINKKFLQANA